MCLSHCALVHPPDRGGAIQVINVQRYSAVASLLPLCVMFRCRLGRAVANIWTSFSRWLFSVLGLPLSVLYLHRLLTQEQPQDARDITVAVPDHTRDPACLPSIAGAKDGRTHEAYPMEKLAPLPYATSQKAATTSLDSDIAGSLDPASPLVRQTPPPGFQQAFYSSYSARPSPSDTSQVTLSQN